MKKCSKTYGDVLGGVMGRVHHNLRGGVPSLTDVARFAGRNSLVMKVSITTTVPDTAHVTMLSYTRNRDREILVALQRTGWPFEHASPVGRSDNCGVFTLLTLLGDRTDGAQLAG